MRARKDDIELLHQYGIYPSRREIELFDYIDTHTVERTCNNIRALDYSEGPITIYLNTGGGNWYDGMALYDTILSCKNHVTVVCTGHSMSMGTIIMQAADERLATPHCRFMIHYGSDGFEGHSMDMVRAGQEQVAAQKIMEDIYLAKIKAKHPKYTRSKLKALMAFDKYMSAKDFVDLGLADKVVGDE